LATIAIIFYFFVVVGIWDSIIFLGNNNPATVCSECLML